MSTHLQNLKNQIDELCAKIQNQSEDESIGKLLVATGSLYQKLLIFKHVQENDLVSSKEIAIIQSQAKEALKEQENEARTDRAEAKKEKLEEASEPELKSPSEDIDANISAHTEENRGKNINIGLNDRVAYLRKLFSGDENDYSDFILSLNQCKNMTEVLELLNSEAKQRKWNLEDEIYLRLIDAAERAKG